jgi:hypothetical protein
MTADRDRIVADIMDVVRRDVEYLVSVGKDPTAVADLLTHTLGSLRALGRVLEEGKSPRLKSLSRAEVDECVAMRKMMPDFARFICDSAVESGAHPLSLYRRLQDSMLTGIEEDPPPWGLG